MKYKIVDLELPTEYRDEGPWRSYRLDTHGDDLSEMLSNASITATDQDGGELYAQEYGDCDDALADDVVRVIAKAIESA